MQGKQNDSTFVSWLGFEGLDHIVVPTLVLYLANHLPLETQVNLRVRPRRDVHYNARQGLI